MSQFSSLIQSFEAKIKETEANIAAALANYHGLNGLLAGLQNSLSEAKTVVNLVAPASSVADGLSVASNAVEIAQEVSSSIESEIHPEGSVL